MERTKRSFSWHALVASNGSWGVDDSDVRTLTTMGEIRGDFALLRRRNAYS